MKYFMLAFILLGLTSASSFAASCYRAGEAEAEQGIRIHSELMVIGLNCQHMATANGRIFTPPIVNLRRSTAIFSVAMKKSSWPISARMA